MVVEERVEAAVSQGLWRREGSRFLPTSLGWRFVNPVLKAQYGIDSMPETGENVAEQFGISRADQDKLA